MNLYFLVEGLTERKVYPQWLNHLLPSCYSRVSNAYDVNKDDYFLISGGGYPSILDNHLRSSIEEVNDCGNYDWLILVIDADEMSIQDKTEEVHQFIETNNIVLNANCQLHVITQKCCMEAWFLGNRAVYTKSPSKSDFGKHNVFYDVSQNDPELMVKPTNSEETLSIYHYEYLKQMLLERNVRYSKTKPNDVGESHYLSQLKKRVNETNHLSSLKNFLNFCESI